MKRFSHLRKAAALGLFAASLTAAHAVDINARIRGTVTDPAGAVIPNAQVVATNQATGVKFTTTSQANGDYQFQQVPVGTYTITATAPGFKSFSATGIVLNIDQEYTEPVRLDVGSTSETISVQADSVQVNTTDMQLNNIVTSSQIQELPLIGRNFTALELTLPGVQLPDTRFAGTFSVSGAQAQQSEYLINGADTNDIALNTIAIVPNLDAIEQFNLIDGPLNAEYDRNSGGIVSATITQGTNKFHGDAFEFYRDTFLNTNNFFQKTYGPTGLRTDVVSPYHQHIFGGTIGGPIFRDKLFFFFAYQGTRQRVPGTITNNTVYTPGQIAGNYSADLDPTVTTRPCSPTQSAATNCNSVDGTFSAALIPSTIKIAGCSTPGETFAQCAFDLKGNFPTSAFNAISSKLVAQYVPVTASGTFNYNSTSTTKQDQYIGRVDFNLNPKNQFTALGIYQPGTTSNGLPFSGSSLPGFGDGSLSHISQYTADYVRQVSSSAVNDLSAHYTRFNFNSGAPQQTMAPSSVGFAITPQDPTGQTLPTINVNGGPSNGFVIGGTNNGPQPRIDQVIQLDDNFSKTFGHHNIKFGYDGRRFNVSNTFDASNSGSYSFASSGNFSSGDASLDFLIGNPATYSQGTGSIIQADAYLHYIFAQDTWKATNNLTLSYGLGYSLDTPLRNHQFGGEAVACFNIGSQSTIFPGAPAGMLFPGDPGCSNSAQATSHHTEFGPRFGFAFAPDLGRFFGGPGKFSIRGGFGIYYNRTEEESALQTLGTPPFGFTSIGAAEFGGTPSFANPYADINGGADPTGAPLPQASEANRFPFVEPTKGQNISFASFLPIFNISSYDKSFRAPYSENFQVSVERELPARSVLRMSYVGALGRHNQVTYEGNYETAAGQAACLASASCIANRNSQAALYPSHLIANTPNIASIGEVGSYSSSNYNSLQVSLTKGPSHGLAFQASYTYAHAMDDASSFENSGFGESGARGYNQFNKSLNYGDSTFDTRHHFVFAPVYISPLVRKDHPFAPINLALSGWEVSAISTVATGEPFDISYAGGTARSLYCSINYGFYACPDVPLQIAPLVRGNLRGKITGAPSQAFSKTSFINEVIGTFGNIHRDPYHGPGTINTDITVAKNFILSGDGKIRLQLRLSSSNAFNHTNFANPNSTFTTTTQTNASSTFGNVTAAAAARQTQLAGKIYF